MIKLMNQVGAKSEKELIELIQNGKVSIETTKSFFVMMTQTGAVIVDSTLKRSSSGGSNNNNGDGGPGLPGSIGLIGGIVKIGYDYLFGNSDEPKKESGENPEKPVIADEKPWQYKVKPSESKITDDPKPENPDIVIEPGKDEPSIWDKINPAIPDFILSGDEDKKNEGENGGQVTKSVVQPEIGSKLKYFFGEATGSAHNIERSQEMLLNLRRMGINNTPEGRAFLTNHLTEVLNNPNSIQLIQENGRIVRESLLVGPKGSAKIVTIWEGSRLVTANIFRRGW